MSLPARCSPGSAGRCRGPADLLYVPGMDADTIIGCVAIFAALALLVWLVFWSRRRIERIAPGGGRSAREIHRGLRDGR